MPTLIHIAPDTGVRAFIGVDDTGAVWRGTLKRAEDGGEVVVWTRVRSEFPESRPEAARP